MNQSAFPSSIFLFNVLSARQIAPSIMLATVKIPPTIAHTPVRNDVNDLRSSTWTTIMGEISKLKKTPMV